MKGTVSDLSLIYVQYFQLLVSGDYIGFILTFFLKGWDRNFKTKDWVSSATAKYFCSFIITVGSHIKRQNCQLNYFLGIGKFISRTKFLFYFGLLFIIPRAIHLKLETTRKQYILHKLLILVTIIEIIFSYQSLGYLSGI